MKELAFVELALKAGWESIKTRSIKQFARDSIKPHMAKCSITHSGMRIQVERVFIARTYIPTAGFTSFARHP